MQSSEDVCKAVRKGRRKRVAQSQNSSISYKTVQDVGEPSRYKYEVQAHGSLRTIPNNKHTLMDASISGEKNVIKKEAKKILKYKYLTIVIQCMWNVKNMIPII